MKKIMILAIAAVALAACAKTHDASPVQQKEIGFGTWAQTLTKARATANDNTAFEDGEAFDVFGFKTTAADHIVFDGDDVEATVSGSTVTWDYAPHRFWDPAASSYTFFAVLPAGNLADEANAGDYATTGLFTSNDIVFDDPTAFDNDILVADKEVVAGTGSSAPYTYSDAVELDFNHVASCVDLLVKQDKNLGNAVVKVTALSLLNISNTGHFTVDSYAASAPYVPTVSWDEAATPTTLGTSDEYEILDPSDDTDDVTVSGKTEYASHTAGTTDDTPAELFTGYVFMPQDLVADTQQIKISYTVQVGTEDPNVYTDVLVDIRDFMTSDSDNNAAGTAITAWAPKTKYIYTITIGANVIEFTATVKDWASTVSGYHYLLN